ncbi:hypothetical protein GIB67_029734 [Kingdonia uniflora]|uniref:Uncharacterized protein n=1 Tax=Kingdonia uniflora TaxID=39325 RepID=A0A7J7LLL9_9MAGN|nr:hypothetical protein GIB67_029734 [Kingdonia uniflora]
MIEKMIEKLREGTAMRDILIQAGLVLLGSLIYFLMQGFPKRILSKLRSGNQSSIKSKSHFVQGAQLLARSRSSLSKPKSIELAKDAADQADLALSLNPKDAAAYILKALALEIQGHKADSLRSLDTALSPPAVKSLSSRERGDALFKRAELQMAVSKRRKVDSAVLDLVEAVQLSPENAKAFCLLGLCYEQKGNREEARGAYESARRVDKASVEAREGLDRLTS